MTKLSKNRPSFITGMLCVLSVGLLATACGDSPVQGPASGTLTVGVTTGSQPLASPSLVSAASSVTVTSAKISIGRVRFKSVEGSDSLDFRSDVATVVDMNLNGGSQSIGSISIPAGIYDETRFRIERLDSADGAAFDANPDMQSLSIRVAGYVDGIADSSFVWTATFMEDQVHKFEPFTVSAGDTVNLLFEFDMSQWFSDGAGGTLDPREALSTGSVQSDIENNIKAAFKVIRQ